MFTEWIGSEELVIPDPDAVVTPLKAKIDINGYSYRAKEILEDIILIRAENRYALSSMMMRMQEFYESDDPDVKDQVFSQEYLMDKYAQKNSDKFTYLDDWDGFNVPGEVVEEFFETFSDLTEKELWLKEILGEYLKSGEMFYLIGVHDDGCAQEHEVAHAFWYLYPEYKRRMKKAVKETFTPKVIEGMKKRLTQMGYDKAVLDDEVNAYLCTSELWALTYWFGKVKFKWGDVADLMLYHTDFYRLRAKEWRKLTEKD